MIIEDQLKGCSLLLPQLVELCFRNSYLEECNIPIGAIYNMSLGVWKFLFIP